MATNQQSRRFFLGQEKAYTTFLTYKRNTDYFSSSLPRLHSLVQLIPFVDWDGLLRTDWWLHNVKIDSESKHPVILLRRSPLTTLIIDDARTLYGGIPLTLGFIRPFYWIVGGKAFVCSFILNVWLVHSVPKNPSSTINESTHILGLQQPDRFSTSGSVIPAR